MGLPVTRFEMLEYGGLVCMIDRLFHFQSSAVLDLDEISSSVDLRNVELYSVCA